MHLHGPVIRDSRFKGGIRCYRVESQGRMPPVQDSKKQNAVKTAS